MWSNLNKRMENCIQPLRMSVTRFFSVGIGVSHTYWPRSVRILSIREKLSWPWINPRTPISSDEFMFLHRIQGWPGHNYHQDLQFLTKCTIVILHTITCKTCVYKRFNDKKSSSSEPKLLDTPNLQVASQIAWPFQDWPGHNYYQELQFYTNVQSPCKNLHIPCKFTQPKRILNSPCKFTQPMQNLDSP